MEVINSFFNNIKDKLTNPFFGTFILVLILHHWELIFVIFNFDEGFNLTDKLAYIKTYILNNISFKSLIIDALQALLYMLIGYFIVVLTRTIVLWIEFSLMPLITGKIVNKNVVRKSEYDEVVKEREQYFDQYEEQRKKVRDFSKTLDKQIEQIKEKDDELIKRSNNTSKLLKEFDDTNKKLENVEKIKDNKIKEVDSLNNTIEELQRDLKISSKKLTDYNSLFFDDENKQFYSTINKFPPSVLNKVNELKEDNQWKGFIHIGNFFDNGGHINGELLTNMIKRGLAFERGSREGLTPIGMIIYKNRKVFEIDFDDNYALLI